MEMEIEQAARLIGYISVLLLGILTMAACVVIMARWFLLKLLNTVGLYRDFAAFTKARKRNG